MGERPFDSDINRIAVIRSGTGAGRKGMEKYREHKKSVADWSRFFRKFWENRCFMGILLLTAVCAYGYKVTNVTIGIDDTPSLYYFEEGLIAIVGRRMASPISILMVMESLG